jgi:uncharacterized surface protein with fasciclin (FAS1) repeats
MKQSKRAPATESVQTNPTAATKNIVDAAIAAGNLTTFAAALRTAGMVDAMAAKGPFTVFAPTDAAFMQLASGTYAALLKEPAKLAAVVKYHVVAGRFSASDMKPGEQMTLQGSTLTIEVSASGVRVNGAHLTLEVAATNGIVHAIDAVILPKNWHLTAVAA